MEYIKGLDDLALIADKALDRMSNTSSGEFLIIIKKAKKATQKELSRLIGRLSLTNDPEGIESDIIRVQHSLDNIEVLQKKLIVNAGMKWEEIVFPKIQRLGLKDFNRFEKLVGLPLSGFGKIDELQLRVASESWRGMLGKFTDDNKKYLSSMLTEHIMSGVGDKKALVKKITEQVPPSSPLRGGRIKNFVNAELARINRETSAVRMQAYENFRLSGPVDSKTSKICLRNVGFIRTKEAWITIKSDIFSYGLHYACRHKLYPVKREWLKTDAERSAFDNGSRVLHSQKDMEFIQNALT